MRVLGILLCVLSFLPEEGNCQYDTLKSTEVSLIRSGNKQFYTKTNDKAPFTGVIVEYYYGTAISQWVQKIEAGQVVEIAYFYEDGNKKSFAECGYQGEIENGIYREWYKDGKIKAEGHYSKGEKNGLWTYYHTNGYKESQGKFSKDQKIGKWEKWDEKGISEM